MITHGHSKPTIPGRTVVIGAGGFVGSAIVKRLEDQGAPVLGLGRGDVDLLKSDAESRLASHLRDADTVVLVSANAPVKNHAMLVENLQMLEPIIAALRKVHPAHLVYISSDAVYHDSDTPLTEASCADPGSLHGAMHRSRELVLETELASPMGVPLSILRPTLIYGADDPHNGYGPNRFRRLAQAGEDIVLFGEGEERRDHVDVLDVADLASRLVLHRSAGILNAATGTVTSFREIAELVIGLMGSAVAIQGSPRVGAMPHNGYRPFDPTGTHDAFPNFSYTTLADGLARAHREAAGEDGGST